MTYQRDKHNGKDHNFLRRWSMRKLEANGISQKPGQQHVIEDPQPPLSSLDPSGIEQEVQVPDVDTLTETSDLADYFSEQVSEALRKAALRKIFRLDKFNICDGLDDYAEDYTTFESLGDVLAAKLKLRKVSDRVKSVTDLDHRDENAQVVPHSNVQNADEENRIDDQAADTTGVEDKLQLRQSGANPVADEDPKDGKT